MSIETIINESNLDSGVRFSIPSAARKICDVLAIVDFGLLSMHLGLDRYGSHDIESSMFLCDPVNYNPAKKQRVHEIFDPAIAENQYANAALYAAAAPFFVLGLVSYPVEKILEYLPVAAERVGKRYENNRVYKAFSEVFNFIGKMLSIDEAAEICAAEINDNDDKNEKKEAVYNDRSSPPIAASLQNLLNKEGLPQVHGGAR